MHRIFLSREQAETLVVFCKQRGLRDFRVANDDGVYVGQTYREESFDLTPRDDRFRKVHPPLAPAS